MKKTRIHLPRNSFDHDWYLTIFAFSFFHSFLKILTLRLLLLVKKMESVSDRPNDLN